jgi:hypothetical protein
MTNHTQPITHHDILRQLKHEYGVHSGHAQGLLQRATAIANVLRGELVAPTHPNWTSTTVQLALESIERQVAIWRSMM